MRKDIQRMEKVMAQIKNPSFPPPTENEMKASTTSVDLNIPDPSKQLVNRNLGPAEGSNANLRLSEKIKNVSDDKRPGGRKPTTMESIKGYIDYFFN